MLTSPHELNASKKKRVAAFAAIRTALRRFDQALDLARCVLDADAAVPGVSLEREGHIVRQPALNLLAPLAVGEEIGTIFFWALPLPTPGPIVAPSFGMGS